MSKYVFEICCGSIEDAIVASQVGANRIEINSSLEADGLTPSIAVVDYIKQNLDIETMAMIRCRGYGFNYSDIEFNQMLLEADTLLRHNVDGLVFGSLNNNFSINSYQTKTMCDLAHQHHKQFVFHKAIDIVNDIDKSFEQLIHLNVDRVLTSGGCANIDKGLQSLNLLQQKYGQYITILAGGGLNDHNVKQLKDIGITQFHGGCKKYVVDNTCKENQPYIKVDRNYAMAVRKEINTF